MISLLKFTSGKWEKARGYLRLDLEAIESAINRRWGATFGDSNLLQPGAIDGDATPATRYVANTGVDNLPTWDQVDLSNGVKSRLPYSHLVAATQAGIVIGRRSGSAGDFEELTTGPGISVQGLQLEAVPAELAGALAFGRGQEGEDGAQGPPGSGGLTTVDDLLLLGYWTILTNGDPAAPAVEFDSNGDVIPLFVPY